MIIIEDLYKAFGDFKVLDGVNLTVEDHQIMSIIGKSGTGKSVLLKNIIGLLAPDSGSITVDGINTSGFTDAISNYNNIAVKNDERITSLISSLNKNSLELSQFLNQSSSTALILDSLLTKVNNGEGTLGAMVKYDSLYNTLNNAVISIDSLVGDIKKNPSKYVNVSVF